MGEASHEFNLAQIDASMVRLRLLLNATRRGFITCAIMTGAYLIFCVFLVGMLIANCLMGSCGVISSLFIGVPLIFAIPLLTGMVRASADYAIMYNRHLADYRKVERMRSFVLDIISFMK